MKYTILILLSILILHGSDMYCQRLEIAGSVGFGSCVMNGPKTIQKAKLQSIPLPAKITEDFPRTMHFSAEFNVHLKKFSAGFTCFFLSSGSRISYSDYSGEIRYDLIINNYGLGPSIMFPLVNTKKLQIGPRIQLPVMFSKITENEYVRLFEESESFEREYYSLSMGLFPSIEASSRISFLRIGLKLGYLFDSKGRLVNDDNRTIYLNNEGYLTSDWSGFQIDFLVGFNLFDRTKMSSK